MGGTQSFIDLLVTGNQMLFYFVPYWVCVCVCVCVLICSVVSDSLWPHGLQPTRLLCPWDFLHKSTLQRIFPAQRSKPCLLHLVLASGYFTTVPPGKPLMLVKVKVYFLSRVQLFVNPWTVAHQAPLSMEFYRQDYWSGLPFPSPRELPDPGIEPRSPALQAASVPSEPPGKPSCW